MEAHTWCFGWLGCREHSLLRKISAHTHILFCYLYRVLWNRCTKSSFYCLSETASSTDKWKSTSQISTYLDRFRLLNTEASSFFCDQHIASVNCERTIDLYAFIQLSIRSFQKCCQYPYRCSNRLFGFHCHEPGGMHLNFGSMGEKAQYLLTLYHLLKRF